MFAARSAPCGAAYARVNNLVTKIQKASGSRGGRCSAYVVAMGRRSKSKKARKEAEAAPPTPAPTVREEVDANANAADGWWGAVQVEPGDPKLVEKRLASTLSL
jgi:hypothetical protein